LRKLTSVRKLMLFGLAAVFSKLGTHDGGYEQYWLFGCLRIQAPVPLWRFDQRIVSSALVREHFHHVLRAFARWVSDEIYGVPSHTGLLLSVRENHGEDRVAWNGT
jgi:hypothetical protein